MSNVLIKLTATDSWVFATALLNSFEPSLKLKKAVQKYKQQINFKKL